MGALVQLDGSPFDWLEGRGPAMTLLGAIDDATSTVLALHFRPAEDLHGDTTLLRQVARQYGLPLALYGDRLNVFVRNDRHWTLDEELDGAQQPTHFGRMLRALGIGYLPAGSPPRPKAASSACGAPCRIASSASGAGAGSPRLKTPTPSCPSSSPTSTAASLTLRPRPSPPGARRHAISSASSAAATPASSPAITPSASGPAGSRSPAGRTAAPTPAVAWSSANCSMAQPTPGPEFVLQPRHAPHSERRRRLHASRRAVERGALCRRYGGTSPFQVAARPARAAGAAPQTTRAHPSLAETIPTLTTRPYPGQRHAISRLDNLGRVVLAGSGSVRPSDGGRRCRWQSLTRAARGRLPGASPSAGPCSSGGGHGVG